MTEDTPSLDRTRRFHRESGLEGEIADLLEPAIVELGFRLVRVRLSGQNGQTLQIMAERPDGGITVGELADISRAISPLIDVHDPIRERFHLEVSSPGIDRPLVRPEDVERWVGHEARVELKEMVSGRRRFRGILEGFEDGEIRLVIERARAGQKAAAAAAPAEAGASGPATEVIGLPTGLVQSARLVLTDELLKLEAARQDSDPEIAALIGNIAGADDTSPETEDVEDRHGPDRRKRKPAGAAADRGRRRTGEVDRPAGGHRRHGRRDPEGG
ncbi:MAG: ribosome maturation factor RimP [Hyphomicrobiaceae bacterium]